mmetsp:Transcript_34206/g.43683  ORF Transcript_34206/g.43683 Transcript_34206/m.43683 type:complete len:379 (+) Transcript_34206:70-1206(+)
MKYPRTGQRGAPQAFARKLFEILDVESADIVSWNIAGNAFFVKETERFSKEILMKYFRHSKFASFQRQLNLYGFRKITRGPDAGAYAHQYFRRGQPDLLILVRRSQSPTPSPLNTPTNSNGNNGFAFQENEVLQPQINAMFGNIMSNRDIMRNNAVMNPFHIPQTSISTPANPSVQTAFNTTADNFVFDDPIPVLPINNLSWQIQPIPVQTSNNSVTISPLIETKNLVPFPNMNLFPKIYGDSYNPLENKPESTLIIEDPMNLMQSMEKPGFGISLGSENERIENTLVSKLRNSLSKENKAGGDAADLYSASIDTIENVCLAENSSDYNLPNLEKATVPPPLLDNQFQQQNLLGNDGALLNFKVSKSEDAFGDVLKNF